MRGVAFQLSSLPLKICSWVSAKMSLNCMLSGSNGFSAFQTVKVFNEEKVEILLKNLNVSKEQNHSFAALFETIQGSSLTCSKHYGHHMSSSNTIICTLEFLSSSKDIVEKWYNFVTENIKPDHQMCPVHDNDISRNLDLSFVKDSSTFISWSTSSASYDHQYPLKDQFNVSMNHVHAFAILVSTFYHEKEHLALDQKTFEDYTEKTAFERPLTTGVAYALRVLHSMREKFEEQQGWTIKKIETEDRTLSQDLVPENLDPSPIHEEYAPVIFSQKTVSHIVSIDMMSGKEGRENIL
ncbi:hypothetical protein ACH5RR_037072 [Cinchona calisaya]|uniref:CHASE domain-containing protein n=1 Tax=Cinchona calisaya TaxID=153742 RepID=A0ABD2YAJ6_9GENT